jgi:poly(3-hydroxybutyrate) depolymerase
MRLGDDRSIDLVGTEAVLVMHALENVMYLLTSSKPLVRITALGAALCLSQLSLACAPADDADLADEPAAETAAQWTDPVALAQPNQAAPAASSCARVQPSTDCDEPLAPGVERVCRLGGRSYTVRAGKSYDPCKPAAVVVDLPSVGESAATHLGHETFCLGNVCWSGIGSGWAAESDTPNGGFLVVVPHGNLGRGDSEVGFLRALVNELKRVASVDAKRVYTSGLGVGGAVAAEAVCQSGDFFSGVSPNSASFVCSRLERPVPVIGFGARGDLGYAAHRQSIETLARQSECRREPVDWRKFNASTRDAVCRTSKGDPRAQLVPCTEVTSAKLEQTSCQVWSECRGGVAVVWCDVAPNSEHGRMNAATDALVVYENDTNLNTPSVAWRFFRQFSR